MLAGTAALRSSPEVASDSPPASAAMPAIGVSALGTLEPVSRIVRLSAPTSQEGARIDQLFVAEGDWVESSAVVAILDTFARRQAALKESEAKAAVARTRLEQVKAGNKPGEIAAREADLARAEATLQNAEDELGRARQLHVKQAISPEEFDKRFLAWLESETRKSVEGFEQWTKGLRKLSELETRPLEQAPIDLSELLTQVFELAQEQPEAARRQLNLSLPQAPWPLPHISGDRDLLLLAIHNLLDNAIKFSRPGDHVALRASEDGAAVVVEVADTGPGIPQDELPHVWEELYRGQSARGVPGSGLGLALVHAIVQRHGGQVTLRSRAGQGTVFTVRLPIKSTS
jgi:two-component system OmpR family sensor kinase